MKTIIFKRLFGILLVVAIVLSATLVIMVQPQPQVEADAPSQAVFDRWQMLRDIVNYTVVPMHAAFTEETVALNEAVAAFMEAPSAATLTALQDAWRNAAIAWARVELYTIENTMFRVGSISSRPANTAFIDDFIAGDAELDEAFIASIGSTSKGLPALEYLIFGEDNEIVLRRFLDDEWGTRRLQYVRSTSRALQTSAQDLLEEWQAIGAEFLEDEPSTATVDMALRDSANEIISGLQTVFEHKLGDPLGTNTGGEPQPDRVEAPLSDISTELMIANIEGLQAIFDADSSIQPDTLGYDDYLDFVGAMYNDESLSVVIQNQFTELLAALTAIEAPLEIAVVENQDQVIAVNTALRVLQIYIRADMMSELAIETVFTDQDGD